MPLYLKDHRTGSTCSTGAGRTLITVMVSPIIPAALAIPFTPFPAPGCLPLPTAIVIADRRGAPARQIPARVVAALPVPRAPRRSGAVPGMRCAMACSFTGRTTATRSSTIFSPLSILQRKKIKQERRSSGSPSSSGARRGRHPEPDWAFFNRCYRQTYREHRSTPYLTSGIFLRIGRALPQNTVRSSPGAPAPHRRVTARAAPDKLYSALGAWSTFPPALRVLYYQAIEYASRAARRFGRWCARRAQDGAR